MVLNLLLDVVASGSGVVVASASDDGVVELV